MTIPRFSTTVVVNSGAKVSQDIDLRGAHALGIIAPVVTSGQLYLQVGQTSGTYVGRLHDPSSQAAWFWNVGIGSAAVVVGAPFTPFAHAAIEMQNAQTAPRTFTVIGSRIK